MSGAPRFVNITANAFATIGSLNVNTTYYGRVAAVLSGSTSTFSADVTTAILRSLLDGDPPAHWDAVAFIEIGTGRRAPDERDLEVLGLAAATYPLLA